MLGKPIGSITKADPERKMGKTADLACGYGGTHAAIDRFAPGIFSEDERKRIANQWRFQHPATVKYWYTLEKATLEAYQNPHKVIRCDRLLLQFVPGALRIKLPSGRKLAYPFPKIVRDSYGHNRVHYMGGRLGQWAEVRSWFGTWIENVVQAIARDVLAEAILRLEAAGYPIVLHVHDEIVAEVPEGFGSEAEFVKIMTQNPAWALTLPIAAEAWTGRRFR
jgi:DNA polymerase